MSYPVQPGDPIQISASEWNFLIETSRAARKLLERNGFDTLHGFLPENVFYGVPTMDVLPGDVCASHGFHKKPDSALSPPNELVANILPSTVNDRYPLVVALTPAKAGQMARFQFAGIALAKRGKGGAEEGFCAAPDGNAGVVLAKSGLRVFGSCDEWLMVSLDAGAVSAKLGMFDCAVYVKDDEWRVQCYDSAIPEWEMAGVATVNNQQFDVPVAWSPLTGSEVRVHLHFVAPKEETDDQPAQDGYCELVREVDGNLHQETNSQSGGILESTPDDFYYLIAVVSKYTAQDGSARWALDQVHDPGPITLTWHGACTDLLKETLQTGVQEE